LTLGLDLTEIRFRSNGHSDKCTRSIFYVCQKKTGQICGQ